MKCIYKVLFIERDPVYARLIRKLLAENDRTTLKVEFSQRPPTKPECLATEGVDLILLDLGLPDRQGFDTLSKVHAQAPDVAIVVLASLDDESMIIKAVEGGAQDYLVKRQATGNVIAHSMLYAIGHKRADQRITRQNDLLRAINKVFREAIMCETEEELAKVCLAVAEESTRSKFGFIAEVNKAGRLDTIAISNPGWDACRMPVSEATSSLKNMEIRGLRARVIRDGTCLISNKPESHPDWVGTPESHLSLTSFLGVPLIQDARTIGVIALGNKEGGYDSNDQKIVETLSETIVEALMRKRAAVALQRSEEKLRAMFESAPQGVTVSDLNGNILELNETVLHMHGYSRKEELIGRSALELIDEKDHVRAMENLKKTLQEGHSGLIEYTFLRKDGSKFPVELSTALLRDTYSAPVGFIAIIEDITERKKMQERIIVTDRLASIGELASGIAHELNNPLTSVIGFSDLLLEKDLPDDIKEDLVVINREAKRTAEIVKNLLTFARKQPQEKQRIDINKAIQTVLELRAYEQRVHNIEVITRFGPNLPEVTANGFQLQQAFLNIVINAEYFMIEAYGRGTLTIITERVDNIVRVSFADNGPGITEEDLGHLFDSFFTTKEVGKGTGLGMSISYGIVTEHGGKIYAESELGKGATFIVELPILTTDNRGKTK